MQIKLLYLMIFVGILFACQSIVAETIVQEGYLQVENKTYQSNSISNYSHIQISDLKNADNSIKYPYSHQRAWTFSGLPNGQYQVTLMTQDTEKTLTTFKVEHWSLGYASALFGMGLFLFSALLLTLRHYHRKTV